MASIQIISIVVLLILGVSTTLVVLNILALRKISGKINTLELELEKRAKQLDSMKKEYPHSQTRSNSQSYAEDSSASFQTNAPEPQINENGIEIVRNVRGSYSSENQPYIEKQVIPSEPMIQEQLPRSSAPVSLSLLNPNSGNSDFAALWNNLKYHIQNGTTPVQLDMAGIEYLHEKEIEYLHKMCDFAFQKNISIALTGCSEGLRSTLYNDPALFQLIQS
ncbi:MAG: hypothetical protein ACLFVQ_09965 [Chitinispirillaceae bacterium]